MSSNLSIAVVIPVRNRSDLLRECLRGIARQDLGADQIEVIVCDDGSTEDLAPVVDEFRSTCRHLRLVRQTPRGPAAARNLGIRETSAPIVAFVDSDVLPEPDLLRHLVDALTDHPQWQGAEARVEPIGGQDNPLWDAPVCDNGGHYHTAAIAYRRAALVEVGGLDEAFPLAACEDLELAVRVLKLGPIGFVPQAVVKHPRRRRTLAQRWKARRHWRYVAILAKRYGFLGWPKNKTSMPRVRTALSAVIALPLGRIRQAIRWMFRSPPAGMVALGYAFFDILCGLTALPAILFDRFPPRRNYVGSETDFD